MLPTAATACRSHRSGVFARVGESVLRRFEWECWQDGEGAGVG